MRCRGVGMNNEVVRKTGGGHARRATLALCGEARAKGEGSADCKNPPPAVTTTTALAVMLCKPVIHAKHCFSSGPSLPKRCPVAAPQLLRLCGTAGSARAASGGNWLIVRMAIEVSTDGGSAFVTGRVGNGAGTMGRRGAV
jgi:hypothetical protein